MRSSCITPSAGRIGVWLPYSQIDARARLRLFCFNHAGGTALAYRGWRGALGPGIEVLAVQRPGREGRLDEPPFERMAPLVDAMLADLAPLMDRPVALFGHSAGGMIALEVARRLEGRVDLRHLFIAGLRSPAARRRESDSVMHSLSDRELIEELREPDGTPPEILDDPEAMALFLPMIRADYALVETHTYAAGPGVSCPITTMGGRDDEDVSVDELEGWREQTTGSFERVMFAGGHFFVRTAQDAVLSALTSRLRPCLTVRGE